MHVKSICATAVLLQLLKNIKINFYYLPNCLNPRMSATALHVPFRQRGSIGLVWHAIGTHGEDDHTRRAETMVKGRQMILRHIDEGLPGQACGQPISIGKDAEVKETHA